MACEIPTSDLPQIDTTKRYDVYCTEMGQRIVVHRNALFKGRKRLLSTQKIDVMGQFIELEQSNGQTVYLSQHSVIKFCEPNTESASEVVLAK